jgi:hypothetical protein
MDFTYIFCNQYDSLKFLDDSNKDISVMEISKLSFRLRQTSKLPANPDFQFDFTKSILIKYSFKAQIK